jgi:hypothetical protein
VCEPGHRFALYPRAALAPDRWYALLMQADDFLRVQEAEVTLALGQQKVWRWPFFSGSAPRVVAARLTDYPRQPTIDVTFSEPLKITSELCVTRLGSARAPSGGDCESLKGTLSAKVLV